MSDPIVKITVNKNASLRIECPKAEITMPDGPIVIKEGKFSICRCGNTAKQPFCDGTHKTCGFDDSL